jgi:threonyl-tRNA synthetase
VHLVPVNDKIGDYGPELIAQLRQAGVRATLDGRNEKLGAKLRRAQSVPP